MLARSSGLFPLLLLTACTAPSSLYMSKVETSSYAASLTSPPAWEGSPVRVVVGPSVNYYQTRTWDDIGHPYQESGQTQDTEGVTVDIFNQTDKPVRVDWERSSLTDAGGHVRRILHSGAAPATRGEPQAATVIPEHGQVSTTIYPADGMEFVNGQWLRQPFLPIKLPDPPDAQLSLLIAVVVDGALVTIPQPISAHIQLIQTTSKSGDRWPGMLAPCKPLVGCAQGFTCLESESDFRCVPFP